MKLSTKAQYAVMAMVELARDVTAAPVSLSFIAEKQSLPLQYLEQLFSKLRQKGLVKSARGQKGGYVLAKPAHEISILTVMDGVGEPIRTTRCQEEERQSCLGTNSRCLTHRLWKGLSLQMNAYLSEITLEDVCHKRFPLEIPEDPISFEEKIAS